MEQSLFVNPHTLKLNWEVSGKPVEPREAFRSTYRLCKEQLSKT